MRSTPKISINDAEMAFFLCDPSWLAGEVDVVATGRTGEEPNRTATAATGRNWILCSSSCGLALIRLGPKPGGSGDGSSKDDGQDPESKSDPESTSEADNDDDANLSICDMVRIQREIGRLSDQPPESDQPPGNDKPPSKALAS